MTEQQVRIFTSSDDQAQLFNTTPVNQFRTFGKPEHLAWQYMVGFVCGCDYKLAFDDKDDLIVEQCPGHFGAFPAGKTGPHRGAQHTINRASDGRVARRGD